MGRKTDGRASVGTLWIAMTVTTADEAGATAVDSRTSLQQALYLCTGTARCCAAVLLVVRVVRRVLRWAGWRFVCVLSQGWQTVSIAIMSHHHY